MAIQFTCPCGRSFNVATTVAGRKGRCPECGSILVVPTFAVNPAMAWPIVDQPSPSLVSHDDDFRIRPSSRRRKSPLSQLFIAAFLFSIVGGLIFAATKIPDGIGDWKIGPRQALLLLACTSTITLPIFLSRSGYLSTLRWLIVSAFFFCVCLIGVFLIFGLGVIGDDNPIYRKTIIEIVPWISFVILTSTVGVPGCLLAAAIHKKRNP
jgi:hypothetical protein